jgi:hypothetical protein
MNRTLALCLLLPAALLSAKEGERQKAGLWNVSVIMQAPDESSEIGSVLSELGLQIPDAEPVLYQVCITPEQAAMDRIPPLMDPDSGCRLKNSRRAGNRYFADAVCEGSMQGRGTLEATLHGPENFSGSLQFNGAMESGMPVVLNSKAEGRWAGADCQGIQPYKL